MAQTKDRIERIYTFIVQQREQQRVPTHREIAVACAMSVATVSRYLTQLEAQGRIELLPYQARNIRLVDNTPRNNEVADNVYAFLKIALADGVVPSQDDIAEGCYLSRTAVRQALAWLEGQGKIDIGSGQRSIQLVADDTD